MKTNYSRRSFFTIGRSALAAVGLASCIPPLAAIAEESPNTNDAVDYYDKLGVEKIINAAGTYTMFTAAVMPPSVQQAVAKAAWHPVRLKDLQLRAGSYIADKLHCEAALVSAGAASALTLGTAACVTVANQNAGSDIPQNIPQGMSDLKNEVIMQKGHRYGYDHALSNCGVRIIEVVTLDQYQAAFNPKTVLAHFFNAAESGQIGREDWIRVAHQHNVPCMNDAAADMPPISNLWNYTKMGFDLVAFSGGKGIRGPQNAGLLLGRKDLIAAAANNNNSIDDVVGRGQKVAKEQIVGMVAAVDWILSQTDEGMDKEFRARANRISSYLRNVPSLKAEIIVPPVANHVPHLVLRYDQNKVKIPALKVAEMLRKGTPSIELEPGTGRTDADFHSNASTIVVGVWMLQPGEDMIVAKRLRQVLMGAVSA
ncbi:MAG TPA: aminotransferase class V-fold PLP-dependent enzyme [Acidobacteriaceae bacterium]|jgi:L-seryl-tRNA(Ser) seleniumtransferase|nr:aminotransferase class V-fold PLP-dependent enzyme [Acidobacteriaceae bacterium]